jgi:hypothetical protein
MLDYKCFNLDSETVGYIGKEKIEVESESAYKELYEDYKEESLQFVNGN